MYTPRRKIFWFAIISRIVILILQLLCNCLCSDHNADAFKSPNDSFEPASLCDNIVMFLLSGFSRWDGQYFLHIAKYGYTYENTLAFYPLYPILIRIISIPIRLIFFALNIHSSVLIAAVLINIVCFVKSAVTLYDLSKELLKDTNIAYKAAILYCINPANIFFSAIYSESLFAYLTFYSMLRSLKFDPYTAFPIGLSIVTRSNGIVNIGFPIYFELKKLFYNYTKKIHTNSSLVSYFQITFKLTTLKSICLMCNTIVISIVPFILLQIYNYILFCIPNAKQTNIPPHIINYSIEKNLVLSGSEEIDWCVSKIPVAYSYVQKKYWNVGFLKYYEIKQIPNFILAFPILYIMVKCTQEYIFEHKSYFYTLGFHENTKNTNQNIKEKYPAKMFVFIVHGLFLTVFCILFIHIQVSTRLISSASPLMYWYCALKMSCIPGCVNGNTEWENVENMSSKWKVFLLTEKKNWKDKLMVLYFLGYTVVGCFMFSNFLPWT